MRRRRLRKAAVGLFFHGMGKVGKLDGILDEKYRDVIANEIPIPLLGVELHRKAAHVACKVGRAAISGDCGKPYEHRGPLADFAEHKCGRQVAQAVGELEMAVRRQPARMDDTLGDALMVEVENLFAQNEVFEQRRAARARLQAVVVV